MLSTPKRKDKEKKKEENTKGDHFEKEWGPALPLVTHYILLNPSSFYALD